MRLIIAGLIGCWLLRAAARRLVAYNVHRERLERFHRWQAAERRRKRAGL